MGYSSFKYILFLILFSNISFGNSDSISCDCKVKSIERPKWVHPDGIPRIDNEYDDINFAFKTPENIKYLKVYFNDESIKMFFENPDLSFKAFKNLAGISITLQIYRCDTICKNIIRSILKDISEISSIVDYSYTGNILPPINKNIQFLYLGLNGNAQFENLSFISDLINLKSLRIGAYYLRFPLQNLRNLKNLQTLEINIDTISEIPESIGDISNLRWLEISSKNSKTLPKSIVKLNYLQVLHLYTDSLAELPADFGSLTSLCQLYIHSSNISRLPVSFSNLQCLYALDIDDNDFESFPVELCHLKSIKKLRLKVKNLESFPKGINQLDNLDYLIVYDVLTGSGKDKYRRYKKIERKLKKVLPGVNKIIISKRLMK